MLKKREISKAKKVYEALPDRVQAALKVNGRIYKQYRDEENEERASRTSAQIFAYLDALVDLRLVENDNWLLMYNYATSVLAENA